MQLKPILYVCALSVLLTGCARSDNFLAGFRENDAHDRYQNLTREDFRNLNRPEKVNPKTLPVVELDRGAPPVPDVAQILAAPRPPKIQNGKLVSIAVTDDVPLRDVLFELARLADVDLELGNGIEGGVNFRATNKPFNEVIERVSDLGGLRYTMQGGILRVERDTPYIKNYTIDFLNIVRSSTSSVSLSTNVLSSGTGGSSSGGSSSGGSTGGSSGGSSSGSGLTSGTAASISATSDSDLWSALDASIAEILSYRPNFDPNTDVAAAGGAAGGAALGAGATGAAGAAGAGYVINRQAGIISVNGTQRQQEMVSRFLDLMKRNASGQVLIEAKIVEVTLNDQFRTGINWDSVLDRFRTNLNFQPQTAISPTGSFAFGLTGDNSASLEDVVSLVQDFGTTRTLSSPRLHAINNQQSVLTFAQNRIFFRCNQDTGSSTTSGGGSTTTTGAAFSCEDSSVPIGIILTMLPSINLDTQEVTLNVRPTLSRQVSTVSDPGTALIAASIGGAAAANIQNAIPIIEVRELDSVMKLKTGGVMVIGGLLEEATADRDLGVPGVSEIPWLGNAFKSREDSTIKRELIIFIKATIVNSDGYHQPADKQIYEKFTTDPRPLNL
jgi:MSHA biogenesis protein MshL